MDVMNCFFFFYLLSSLDRIRSSLESFVVHLPMAIGCVRMPTASQLFLKEIQILYLNTSRDNACLLNSLVHIDNNAIFLC